MAKTKSNPVVGRASAGQPIIDGKLIFQLMDSHGLPLEIIQEILRRKNCGFDVPGFIRAAKTSKNYSKSKLLNMIYEANMDMTPEARTLIQRAVDREYTD